jgi:hypothetical protein
MRGVEFTLPCVNVLEAVLRSAVRKSNTFVNILYVLLILL